jgi:hypothetical protein
VYFYQLCLNQYKVFHDIRASRHTPNLVLIFLLYQSFAMASSSSSTIFTPQNTNQTSFFKLDNNNYLMWMTQVRPILRTHDLMGIVDGLESCPQKLITDYQGKGFSI